MLTTKLRIFLQKVLAYKRRYRFNFLLSKINICNSMNIIDIGCGIDGRSLDDHIPYNWKWRITGIDVLPESCIKHEYNNFNYIKQDAQDLSQFRDNEFDLAISMGMLEHIPGEKSFKKVVSEIRRVAKQYAVVVPFKYCLIEPHFGVPFFPIIPYSVQLALIKFFNLHNLRKAVIEDYNYVKNNYRWLTNTEYSNIFYDSTVYLIPPFDVIAIIKKSPL